MIQYYSCSHSQKWPKICLIYSSCTDLITLAQQEPTKASEQQEEEQVEKTLENVCKYSTHIHTHRDTQLKGTQRFHRGDLPQE